MIHELQHHPCNQIQIPGEPERDYYLIKLLKILGIQLIIDLRNKCSLHLIYLIPVYAFKKWMNLREELRRRYNYLHQQQAYWKIQWYGIDKPYNTLISSAPLDPNLWLTLHKSLLIISFVSGDNFASSGNFKWDFQFTIYRKQKIWSHHSSCSTE